LRRLKLQELTTRHQLAMVGNARPRIIRDVAIQSWHIMPVVVGMVAAQCSIKVKGKGQTLVIAPLCRHGPPQRCSGTWRAPSSIARRIYLPYTFPAVAGTHLPTPKGWRVEIWRVE